MAPKSCMKSLLLWFVLVTTHAAAATPTPLTVEGWSDYLPLQLLQDFTAATGQGVIYRYHNNPSTPAADSNTPADLLFLPAHQLIQQQAQQPLLALPADQLPALELLNPGLLDKAYDPQNRYSRILLTRNSGLLRQNNLPPPNQLTDLLKPDYQGQLGLLQDYREVFALALAALDLPVNTQEEKHLQQAHQFLLQLLPSLHSIADATEIQRLLRWEQIRIGHLHQGDANRLLRNRSGYTFTSIGKNGIQRLDLVVIPATSQQPQAATEFLAWLTGLHGNSLIALHTSHRSPLLVTQGQAPRSGAWMSQRLTDSQDLLLPLPAATETRYQHYWSLFLQSAREAGVHVQN